MEDSAFQEGLTEALKKLTALAEQQRQLEQQQREQQAPAAPEPGPPPLTVAARPPWLFWVRQGPARRLVLLGEPELVWFHWEARPLLCSGRGCQRCPDPGRREYGFFPALLLDTGGGRARAVVLELPEAPLEQLRDRDCRGLAVEVQRLADGRVRLKVEGAETRALPPAFSVPPVLDQRWGVGPAVEKLKLKKA